MKLSFFVVATKTLFFVQPSHSNMAEPRAKDQSFVPHAVIGFLLISQSKTTQD